MRLFNTLVFDEYLYGPSIRYTLSEHNAQLGLADHFSIFMVASETTGTLSAQIIVFLETSPDERNWVEVIDIGAFTLTPGATKSYELFWATTTMGYSAFVRLRFWLFGSPSATRLKAWVAGRADRYQTL